MGMGMNVERTGLCRSEEMDAEGGRVISQVSGSR